MTEYLIVGASAAGLAAAEQIRSSDSDGEITILTKEEFLPYSRPSISYLLKGSVKQGDMLLRPSSYYKRNGINVVTNCEVTRILPKKKEVKAGRKTFSYDKLCLATGSKPFIPPMKNACGKLNFFTFLDLASAKAILSACTKETRAVVIGGGLIGMKAAEGLSKICKSVDVVEFSPRILPSILDERAAKSVKKYIEEKGRISFHLQDTVVEAKAKGKRINRVVLKSGKELKCDLLVSAVGVRPEIELAREAGLEIDMGIVTNERTMQTSEPDIYAAGDCCVSLDMLDAKRKIIALWPNAVGQGRVAGSQMAGGSLEHGASLSVNAIDFFEMRICTCGLVNASGGQYSEIVRRKDGEYKRLVLQDNKLVGFVLVNSSENAGIYTSLIESRTCLNELEGSITETPSLFLFDRQTRAMKLTGTAKGVRI